MITRKKKPIAEIQNDRLRKYKEFNFSCETCTKYVSKRFPRYLEKVYLHILSTHIIRHKLQLIVYYFNTSTCIIQDRTVMYGF